MNIFKVKRNQEQRYSQKLYFKNKQQMSQKLRRKKLQFILPSLTRMLCACPLSIIGSISFTNVIIPPKYGDSTFFVRRNTTQVGQN